MSINNVTNLYTNTKYIVSGAGSTPYTTVQSAINAAQAAGIHAIVYIRPGTYTENLTLYSHIDLEGCESTEVIIVGKHTPPTSGNLTFTRIGFSATGTDSVLYDNTHAGTTAVKFTRCGFSLNNGYIAYLTSWTGSITFKYCDELTSTNDGIVYNTGSSVIVIKNSQIGYGTGNAFTAAGQLLFNNADIGCPISLSGSSASVIQGGSTLHGTVTVSSNADLQISNSRMPTGSTPCLSTSSSVAVKCSNVVMDTSNTYAVTTTGTGTYKPNEVTFSNSKGINASVTETLTGVVKTGEIFADTITRLNFTGFYSWAASGPYFDDTTLGSFSVLVGGTGYIKGRLVTWTGSQTVTGMTSGSCWWIYIDETGTIGKTSTRTSALFTDNIVLFQCLYDETPVTKVQYTAKENHGYDFPTAVSNYNHDIIGTVIVNSNNGANITLVGTANVKISIAGSDELEDHGLETTIADTGGTGVAWHKMYTNAGGKWVQQNATDTFGGYYNNAGTPTVLPSNKVGVYTLYVGKDNLNSSDPIYYSVLNTSFYNTSAAATTAISNGTTAKATNELESIELAQLGYGLFDQASAKFSSLIISKTTLRSTTSTGGTNTASLVTTTITNFDGMLSSADTNVQAALDTIDNYHKWTVETSDMSLVADRCYIANKAGLLTFTLPTACAVGKTFRVSGMNTALGWKIAQNANQQIFFGTSSTTVGTGGSLASSAIRDTVELVCIVADLTFNVVSSIGNITIV